MSTSPSGDQPPLLSNRYSIDIDGFTFAEFTEISGASMEVPAAETVVSTGEQVGVMLLSYPGSVSYGDITLRSGRVTNAKLMYGWLQAVVDGKYTESLRNGTIVQLPANTDSPGFTGVRWHFEDAWPSKWEIAPSGAGKTGLVIESLTIKIASLYADG